MILRPFGPTGLSLPPLGLGGMPLSIDGRPGEAQAERVVHAALDGGLRLIDTADVYCLDHRELGHNERLLAEALRQWDGGDRVYVATKGGCTRPDGRWGTDGRPARLKSACEASLKALRVQKLWLYQLHTPDPRVPFADQIGALARLREEGKIEHVGLSNVTAAQIREAHAITPLASVQNRLGPLDTRALRDGVVATCEELGLAFLAYSPVGGRGKAKISGHPVLSEVGRALGASPFEVALAWLLTTSPVVFPIPGASKVSSAKSSVRALKLTLPEAEKARLDRLFLG